MMASVRTMVGRALCVSVCSLAALLPGSSAAAPGMPGADSGCPADMTELAPSKRATSAAAGGATCLARSETTVADYAACLKTGKCTEPHAYDPKFADDPFRAFCNWRHPEGREKHPVNCVSFEQAQAYCAARGSRLPTDAEWRAAASNGGRTKYPWGNAAPDGTRVNGCGTECPPAVKAATGDPEQRATYKQDDGYASTAPVGSFPKGDTASGIHDLAGNVTEFVEPAEAAASTGDLNGGGSCFTRDLKLMNASRFTRTAWSGATSPSLGFRCAQSR